MSGPAAPSVAAPAAPQVSPTSRSGLAWIALAMALFGAGVGRQFGGLLQQDLGEVVAHSTPVPWRAALVHDASYVTWVVGRNARTLATRPWRLFDAEPCAPAEKSLALGEPAISLGILGVPHWLATRDPVRTFNLTLLTVSLLAPLAMFLLVWSWTGEPAAAIAAGLVFGFQSGRVQDPLHLYIWDLSGTVLALLFARRLFQHGRWRDAAALGGCTAFQLGGSLYPLLGSALVALAVVAWLAAAYGLRSLRPAKLALVVGIVLAAIALFLAPALELARSGTLATREAQVFLAPRALLPDGPAFPGWPLSLLALLGITLPMRRDTRGARWALLAGFVLVIWFAAGPHASPLPNLYELASSVIPGLAVVRAPGKISVAALMALAILAGIGVAAALERVPSRIRPWAGVALALATAVGTLGPGASAIAPAERYAYLSLRPKPSTLAFFERLAALGNEGPLYELPPPTLRRQGLGVLLTEYHRRRSSACASSFTPQLQELEEIWKQLPDAAAVRALHGAGFTTILVHHEARDEYAERFEERVAALGQPLLRRLHGDGRMTAYAIELP